MDIKGSFSGLFLVIVIALLSYYISTLNASFDSLAISIIVGLFTNAFLGDKGNYRKGAELAIKIFIPVGIALYGTQLTAGKMRMDIVLGIFFVFSGLFLLTLFLSRIFNLDNKLSILLASGLAICGASAIAIISPIIGARKEDTSVSIISVLMLGLAGMIFYPLLADLFFLSNEEFNFLAGTTLPMIGQVKVAAANYCPECIDSALKIKIIRVLFLLIIVTIVISISGAKEKRLKIPWFVIAFVALAIINNFTGVFLPFQKFFSFISSLSLSAGLAAIGFSVDIDSIVSEGITPLGVILLSWGIIVMLIYIARNIL